MSIELKDTLNLPQTAFPMRANLVEREPQRIKHWEDIELYNKIQEKNQSNDSFILHDGPPFTNGDVHIGAALNKTLKDTILRYKTMEGFSTPYIPGWDCHGLPIEHMVTKELRKKKKDLCTVELRKACAEFSASFIEKQRSQFIRLGILADWSKEYRTMAPEYEAETLRTFATFVENDLVYRSKKPVYWSIPCATALSEAEIEYKDHVSPSIYVKFPLPKEEAGKLGIEFPASLIIWTTTPWTLPSNTAIAVNKNLEYQEVYYNGNTFIVAAKRVEIFATACKLENVKLGKIHPGMELEGLQARHPLIDRVSPIVLGDHVTLEAGTGCVHTAPGHGTEDYITGLQYELDIYSPLDDKGCYVDDGMVPESLVGKSVLEKNGSSEANEEILKLLKLNNALIHFEKFNHSYPHCWRSKTPVIYRAMDQWFISLDKNGIRKKTEVAISQVKWIPNWSENRIRGAVETHSDWCISRQRSWGVPIPAFFDEDNNAVLDPKLITAIADKIEKDGTTIWFELSDEELLKDTPYEGKKLKKGIDTLDVWIESGTSHQAVLKKHKELHWPADLYVEGSDQHRGWFQSSLWTSVVANGTPPYKNVITHGFVVNEHKKKISKSEGKPQTADMYIAKHGADIVRLWVSSEEYRHDMPISDNILKQVVQTYRTLRNTLKFQLGNLYDFDPEKHTVAVKDMTVIDQWAIHQTNNLIMSVTEAYSNYEFHKAYQSINRFCSVTLSAVYHDILKDRLYTYAPDWKERRSSQTAIHKIFHVFIRLLAPILTFTADEAFAYSQANKDFADKPIHLEDFPKVDSNWSRPDATEVVEQILKTRQKVNEQLEAARQNKTLGQSLDAQVTINGSKDDPLFANLKKHETLLPEFFIVSQVVLNDTGDKDLNVTIKQAEGVRCPRSWRWVPNLVNLENFGDVSPRCKDALTQKYPQ